jgi:hypothetical protein
MAMNCRTDQELVSKTGNTKTKRKNVIHEVPAYDEFWCFHQVANKWVFYSEVLQPLFRNLMTDP